MTVRWSVVVSRCVLCVGAQSDSEVVSGGQSACAASDRGYTSDSEVYENRHSRPVDVDVKPTSHGSWLLVSTGRGARAGGEGSGVRGTEQHSGWADGTEHGLGVSGCRPDRDYIVLSGAACQCATNESENRWPDGPLH